ncbi:tyrosine-protein phosphatase [Paenibacillus agaridevorans]
MDLIKLRREFLEAVFGSIESTYGTIDACLEQEFGLDAERRAKVQKHYLV